MSTVLSPTMKAIVRAAIGGELPEGFSINVTTNKELWFTIQPLNSVHEGFGAILHLPPVNTLKMNHELLTRVNEAIKAFPTYNYAYHPNWDMSIITTMFDNHDEETALSHARVLCELPSSYIVCDIETKYIELYGNKVLLLGINISDTVNYIFSEFTPKVLEQLQKFLDRRDLIFTWQNGKFDTVRLKYLLGLDARVDEDTMLLHYSCINEKRGTHGLKDLASLYVQAPKWEDELNQFKATLCRQRKIKQSEFTYDMFPEKMLMDYLGYDLIATRRLFFKLREVARPTSFDIYRILIQASNVFRDIEVTGVTIDLDYLEDYEFVLDKTIEQAEQLLKEAVLEHWDPARYVRETGAKSFPKEFNYKSPAQLKYLLQKVTGQILQDTGAETLELLHEMHSGKYPVLEGLMALRKLHKYRGTYVDGFKAALAEDGRIHGSYNLHGTETGRLSSSNPNMQNIPRDRAIKDMLVAADGFKLVQLDYSQAELRVLAYLSGDKNLSQIYIDGKDVHSSVALDIFGPDFTKEQRVIAKTINFGIVYGIGAGRLSQSINTTVSEAQTYIRNWFEAMPSVKAWIQEQRSNPMKGISVTTPLGRERSFVLTPDNINHVQNEAVNTPVQSIASDMTLISLITIHKWIKKKGLQDKVKIIINVHDSIVLEVYDNAELIQEVAETCTHIMGNVPQEYLPGLSVPFKADVEVGYSWGDLKSYEVGRT